MKIFLSGFLMLCTVFGVAQNDNPENLRSKIFELTVKTLPPGDLHLPFEKIKVIDSRPDTSKLGFRKNTGRFLVTVNKVFEKILLKPGIEKAIDRFYNEYYKNNFTPNGNVLLVSIKKLWINNFPDIESKYQGNNPYNVSQQNIYARFEFYFGTEGSFVPLKRLDTIFQKSPDKKIEGYDPKDENKLPFLCFALEKMIENVNYAYYVKDSEKKNKMSAEDILKYNASATDIPILNEPVKKGVFLTFNEFKNNTPSVLSFSKRKILKKKIYEIVDEKENVIIHYFACFDGEKLAIGKPLSGLIASNISQDNYTVYKIGNSFQFFENHLLNGIGVADNGPVDNSTILSPGSNIVWVPRQLDMDTGQAY